MKIASIAALVSYAILWASALAQSSVESKCAYKGVGKIYRAAVDGYSEDVSLGFDLEAMRTRLVDGSYLFLETKTYRDGTQQQTSFKQGLTIGPFAYESNDGSFKTSGFCTKIGHCAGKMEISEISFSGLFVTDYDASGIRTVTHSVDGSLFSDEVLEPISGECPY